MKRIISLSIMMLCVLFLSAQTAPKERWVNIKLKNQDLISYKVGDVDSIYFTAKDTVKVEDTLSVDLGLSSKLLWAKKDTKNGTASTFSYRPKDYTAAIAEQFGDDWRIATQADFKELEEACTWEATDDGFVGTSKSNGATILLPYTAEDYCIYWDSENQRTYIYISFDRRKGVIFDTQNDSDPEDFKTCAKSVRAVRTKIDNSGSGEDDPTYTGKYKRPEPVDLGLSVKWGSFNLGAESETDFGGYFGWGDVKDSLTVSDRSGLYAHNKFLTGIGGDPDYDIVAAELKGHWRMPTAKEIKELESCVAQKVLNYNNSGVNGYTFTRNGKTIFIPFAGYKNSTGTIDQGQFAYLWSDSTNDANRANALSFRLLDNSGAINPDQSSRNTHMSIRPVFDDGNSGSGDNSGGNDNPDNNKDYVIDPVIGIIPNKGIDMGNGVLWSPYNLGASSETAITGRYYAWGEVTDKDSYSLDNYQSPYSGITAGQNGFYYIEEANDAATKLWGKNWRMPTESEWLFLLNNCSFSWTTQSEQQGIKVTSNVNGNTLFFPAAGAKVNSSVVNSYGPFCYWTSAVYTSSNNKDQQLNWATCIRGSSDDTPYMHGLDRYKGLLIRPVMK